jgi:hypothetical protein
MSVYLDKDLRRPFQQLNEIVAVLFLVDVNKVVAGYDTTAVENSRCIQAQQSCILISISVLLTR